MQIRNFGLKTEKKNRSRKNRKNGVFERLSKTIKDRILSGKITPKTSNRLNHKRLSSKITGIENYRSSWEVKYHEAFPDLLYEKLRIKYLISLHILLFFK